MPQRFLYNIERKNNLHIWAMMQKFLANFLMLKISAA
jgi:hypothetical protein